MFATKIIYENRFKKLVFCNSSLITIYTRVIMLCDTNLIKIKLYYCLSVARDINYC